MSTDKNVKTKMPLLEVQHPDADRMLNEIDNLLKPLAPPGYGYALFVFTSGATGFVSNVTMECTVQMLKEFIIQNDKQEKS